MLQTTIRGDEAPASEGGSEEGEGKRGGGARLRRRRRWSWAGGRARGTGPGTRVQRRGGRAGTGARADPREKGPRFERADRVKFLCGRRRAP